MRVIQGGGRPSPSRKTPKNRNEDTVRMGQASVFQGDAIDAYEGWLAPTCIISDGPYGLGKFPGEPTSTDGLAEWYAPHAAAWARHALPYTTLWFWNSEIGWAKSHAALEMNGWQYEETMVWDKGIAHIAGNVNSKTIRGLPVVTEVAVRYTRKATLPTEGGGAPLPQGVGAGRVDALWTAHVSIQPGVRCGERSHAKISHPMSTLVFPPRRRHRGHVHMVHQAWPPIRPTLLFLGRENCAHSSRVEPHEGEVDPRSCPHQCLAGTAGPWRGTGKGRQRAGIFPRQSEAAFLDAPANFSLHRAGRRGLGAFWRPVFRIGRCDPTRANRACLRNESGIFRGGRVAPS